MKKLGFTLLAAAMSLPMTFAATQATSSTPSKGQAQTDTTKPAKKHTKAAKKHHAKKNAPAATNNTATPAAK